MMEMKSYYPNDSEINEFFTEFIGLENARIYFKKIGILFATNKCSEIAKYASRIIYGYDEIQIMKTITATKQNYDRISGFFLKTDKNIQELSEVFNVGDILKEKNQLRIINTIMDPKKENLTVSFSFTRKTPGKMNLISAEERKGEFKIEKNNTIQDKIIVFNHCKNEDYGAVKDIIDSISQNEDSNINLIPITLEKFKVEEKISFIDKILQYNFDNWKLEEVETIRVRKGEELDEDLEEADKKLLEGINDAVLHGHNLRSNPFVITFEKAGYYFPSIVMKMTHISEPFKISLEIQFKLRPDMPEINIVDSLIVEDDKEKPYILEKEFRREILNYFFSEIIGIYYKM